MRNEQDDTKSPAPTTEEHAHWEMGRLILALVICLLLIGLAFAYEKFG